MNREETANLLTAMAALDRRTIGAADVIAWHGLLTDVAFDDALEAVKRHYAEQTEWMMPAHVRRLVRDVVREREWAASATGWAPGQYGTPKDEAQPEVPAAGRLALGDLPAAVAELVSRVRADLPEGSREKLFPRETAWARDHKAYLRSQGGEPNPLYKPQAAGTAKCPPTCGCGQHEPQAADPGRCWCRQGEGSHEFGVEGCGNGAGGEVRCTCDYNNMSGGHAPECPRAEL